MELKVSTVKQLRDFLNVCIEVGHGDEQVWLMADEEGNYARPLFVGDWGIDTDKGDCDFYGFPKDTLVIG